MKQVNIFDFIEDDYIPSYDISKYQVRNPSYLRADDGTVRQVTRYMEEHIGKLQVVGRYSMYAYEDFTKDEELEFLNKIVKYQNERIKVKKKKSDVLLKKEI